MTLFDYLVLTIVGLSLAFGLWRGMISEVIALVAWGLGIFVAFRFGADLGALLPTSFADPMVRTLIGCTLLFVGVLVLMAIIRMLLLKAVKALGLTVSDRLLGMFFGLARGLLIALLLVAAGGMTSAPSQPWWRDATLAGPLETVVVAVKPLLPRELANRIQFS